MKVRLFGETVREKVCAVYFIALGTLMHYFLEQSVVIGVGFTYRHLFALLFIASAFIVFLVKPNPARAAVSFKGSMVMSIPMFVMTTASLLIWFLSQSEPEVIARGLSYYTFYSNNISAYLVAGAFLYLFAEKGIWFNLISILTANLILLGGVIANHGIGPFLSEFSTLILSFASETGDIMRQAEFHELAFCLGAYLLYMLLKPRKSLIFAVLFALAALCFLVAFKRIAIVGIGCGVLIGYLLRFFKHPKTISRCITGILVILLVVLILYIGLVRAGIFTYLEDIGINTSGRDGVYSQLEPYYEFSPTYLGHGMGYIIRLMSTGVDFGVKATHNDFLDTYINLGFFGYFFWLISILLVRTKYFGRHGKTQGEIIALCMLIVMVVFSMTDNTMLYPLYNTSFAVIIMGHDYNERVLEEEQRLLGNIYFNKKIETFFASKG